MFDRTAIRIFVTKSLPLGSFFRSAQMFNNTILEAPEIWVRDRQTFFIKSHILDIFDFAGWRMFVTIIQLCYCGAEAVIDNMNMAV